MYICVCASVCACAFVSKRANIEDHDDFQVSNLSFSSSLELCLCDVKIMFT